MDEVPANNDAGENTDEAIDEEVAPIEETDSGSPNGELVDSGNGVDVPVNEEVTDGEVETVDGPVDQPIDDVSNNLVSRSGKD